MLNFNSQCRKANLSDNVEAIAKYLHLTDTYIYPRICEDPLDKNWINLVNACMREEHNIFNVQHLSVALRNNNIVGVLCVIPCGTVLKFANNLNDIVPKEFLDRLKPVIDGYFAPLISESLSYSGYNITNVCVDDKHQNQGVGGLLLSRCVEEYGTYPIHLDVIASNANAIRLYKKFGFEISNEYCGYSGSSKKLLCYHMVRMPKT